MSRRVALVVVAIVAIVAVGLASGAAAADDDVNQSEVDERLETIELEVDDDVRIGSIEWDGDRVEIAVEADSRAQILLVDMSEWRGGETVHQPRQQQFSVGPDERVILEFRIADSSQQSLSMNVDGTLLFVEGPGGGIQAFEEEDPEWSTVQQAGVGGAVGATLAILGLAWHAIASRRGKQEDLI